MATVHATEQASYRGYGPRPPIPGVRLFHGALLSLPEFAVDSYERLRASFDEPFVGLTTDGEVRLGLTSVPAGGSSTEAVTEAAHAFLSAISRRDLRDQVLQRFDNPDRRRWFNAFPDWTPSGMLLDDAQPAEQEAAMAIVEASLGPVGYAETRKVMRLNELLDDFVNTYVDSLREFTYFFTIFGDPSVTEPWAWQLMGHHLHLNCPVLPNHVALTPMFMGSEFNDVNGVTVFEAEAEQALAFVRSLSVEQQEQAVLYRTMDPARLPSALAGPVDGRHVGGAGRDNLTIGYEGVSVAALADAQQRALLDLVAVYLDRLPSAQAKQRADEARRHLDETYFAWIGDPAAGPPFYYRIHSPVIWIEFDHHQWSFLDNDAPEPFHVHTIVRTPNGGDYGAHLVPLPATAL